MIGTILNAIGIIGGGILGMTRRTQFSTTTQLTLKKLLGIAAIWLGLQLTVTSLIGAGFWGGAKVFVIILLSMTLGRLLGKGMGIQNLMNKAGQFAKDKIAHPPSDASKRVGDGFLVCTVLFCLGPLAVLGAFQDGLNSYWGPLAVKGVMDALATMAFVTTYGHGAILSSFPVVALQGTITLAGRYTAAAMDPGLLIPLNGVCGLLIFSVALIILELKKISLWDYLPSLALAPLIAWLWR